MSNNCKLRFKAGEGHWSEDENENKSEPFRVACDYSCGFGEVLLNNNNWAYRDMDGNLSEEYPEIFKYSNGFGVVRLENGRYAYRDVDGNLFSESDYNKIKELYKDKVDVYHLEDEVFESDKLLSSVIKKVKRDAHRFIKLAQTNKQLEEARRFYLETMEYVLSTAHNIRMTNEEKEKLEEQERINKQQKAEVLSAKQQNILKELNLENV